MMNFKKLLGQLAIPFLAVTLSSGCNSTPKGEETGRIDPYKSTPADRESSAANISSLLEFSDATVEKLGQDLSELPEIRNAPTKVVLQLGDINNKTNTPTTDFELLGRRIRAKINNSRFFRDHFVIVEDRGRVQRQLDRIAGPGSEDLLQEGGGGGPGVRSSDLELNYVLNGDFLEANRGGRSQYFIDFSLLHVTTGRVIFEAPFDLAQGPTKR